MQDLHPTNLHHLLMQLDETVKRTNVFHSRGLTDILQRTNRKKA